jgi:hypothetical protein
MKLLHLWILSSMFILWRHVQTQQTEPLTSEAGIYYDEVGTVSFYPMTWKVVSYMNLQPTWDFWRKVKDHYRQVILSRVQTCCVSPYRISVSYQCGRYPVSSFRCKMLIRGYATACSLTWRSFPVASKGRHALQWCQSGRARVASHCCFSSQHRQLESVVTSVCVLCTYFDSVSYSEWSGVRSW